MFMAFSLAGVLWAVTKVTPASAIQTRQVSYIVSQNGDALIGRVGAEYRQDVPLSEVPEHVQHAVLAAENRSFYSDPGISPKGLIRALMNNARGGDTQGGSTITQQYAKNVYLSHERTMTRKIREMVLAIKIDLQYSKEQILEWYLNTIYFGRGAYGIEAAADVYFGKSARDLTPAEGAVLAATIRSPAQYDPTEDPFPAMYRFDYVMRTMYAAGWLDRETAYNAPYPQVKPKEGSAINRLDGPNGYIVERVREELATLGYDQVALESGGLTVVTTIDARKQAAAVNAVGIAFQSQPAGMKKALVSLDPQTGAIRAYYGGSVGLGNLDYARSPQPVGSAFKPVVLSTALSDGYSLSTYLNGTSPRWFAGGVKIENAGNASCNPCSILEATRRSVNTAYFDLTLQVGAKNVAEMGHKLGVPEAYGSTPTLQDPDGVTYPGIGLGGYDVRPVDMAAVYSVFANGGYRVQPHFVTQIIDRNGVVIFDRNSDRTRALPAAVTHDVTYALEQVLQSGTGYARQLAYGRPAAGKTGSVQRGKTDDNQDAWFVGFTPQLATAVWVGNEYNEPLRESSGRVVFGSGLPGLTWKTYMDSALRGEPVEDFPEPSWVGGSYRG
jgi:membrane peptidoglycan carboxypeptidase